MFILEDGEDGGDGPGITSITKIIVTGRDRPRPKLRPSIVSQVLRQQRIVKPDHVSTLLRNSVVDIHLASGTASERAEKKAKKLARVNHAGGITAPPMPVGPTRCRCGSGKRPKKCCGREGA